jgi:hypothetical protein
LHTPLITFEGVDKYLPGVENGLLSCYLLILTIEAIMTSIRYILVFKLAMLKLPLWFNDFVSFVGLCSKLFWPGFVMALFSFFDLKAYFYCFIFFFWSQSLFLLNWLWDGYKRLWDFKLVMIKHFSITDLQT